jgi:membrane-bound lytic murein transglycosylase B
MSKYSPVVQPFIKHGLIFIGVLLTLTACTTVEPPQKTQKSDSQASLKGSNSPTQKSKQTETSQAVAKPSSKINSVPQGNSASTSSQNSPVAVFAKQVSTERGISLAKVQLLLSEARYQSTVARLMTAPPPGQAKVIRNWQVYRQRFVEPIRIRGGVAFMQEHAQALQKAERLYDVPAEVIAAIIGIETLYGRNMGDFKVLDALNTLAFYYPPPIRPDRVKLFQDQLADLIELDVAGKIDARTQRGSFAGAIGIPQFMPGSILRYAVSAQPNQRIDLSNNFDDAILSVANFLVEHGWVKGLPIFAPVTPPNDAGKWVDGGLTPYLKWSELQTVGSQPMVSTSDMTQKTDSTPNWQNHLLGVIDLPLPTQDTIEYRVGTPNFFVITQYNRSYFYATAVADLAHAIKQSMQ